MSKELGHFQNLLRELFQFDSADLDFGIYRILNARRDLFEDWIDNRLPEKVRTALSKRAVQEEAGQAERLSELAAKLREEQEDDGVIDGDGRLRDDIKGKTAKEYRALWEAGREGAGASPPTSEGEIYNRLYDFFRRYYDNGDFLSLRRYGADNAYAVPYNGEEVLLHWANKDQYYIKTGEHFADYRFRAGDKADAWHVDFKLTRAESDRDNTKAEDKRFFFFDHASAEVDASTRTLTVPVLYRAATAAEAEALGTRKQQEALNEDAAKKLLGKQKVKAQPALAVALAQDVSEEGKGAQTLLARHLRRYTRRNSSDFFIHKDLGGFLTRELDYWLKAEVLKLDALLAGGAHAAQAWLQVLGCLREVAAEIIAFLASVEDFQKRLYEKRKFVTECHWCVTLDHVERAGLTDALVKALNETEGGKAQKEEWKKLFAVAEVREEGGKPGWKDKVTAGFLRSQPQLVLDTVFTPAELTDALLESFEDLDEATDGLLIHSENWQALNLISERYREKVQCVYIDPPFNTGSDFFYKDTYRFSSWTGFMHERLQLAHALLPESGSMFLHLDHNANWLGRHILDAVFGPHNFINEVTWRIGWVSGYKTQVDAFVRNHDTIYYYGKSEKNTYFDKKNARIPYKSFDKESIDAPLKEIMASWGIDPRRVSNTKISIKYPDGQVFKLGLKENEAGYNMEDTWNSSEYEELNSNKIKRNAAEYTPNGSALTQKPEDLLKRVVELTTRERDLVIDFFAGSGTTAAVAWKLNRRFVTTEMGRHFEEDVLWRIKKIMNGQKVGISRILPAKETIPPVKYLRLESYEDTLNNLKLPCATKGQGALELMDDSYLLGYWLTVETQGSDSLLNIEKLEAPFEYSLAIHDGKDTTSKSVDLPETFAYLIGLIVERRRILGRDGRRYLLQLGRQRAGDVRTAVLWRDIRGWQPADFDAERLWLAQQAPFGDAVVVYVNGDSAIEGAQSLDPVFHARMFAPVH